MKELLEAGAHFGHQTKRWNPKMKEYIFGERNGIYIIDLQKTLKLFKDAMRYVGEMAAQGKTILFVGTKRQAQGAVAGDAAQAGKNHRVCRHQTAGSGSCRRRSHPLPAVLREPTLAGRIAHQYDHG